MGVEIPAFKDFVAVLPTKQDYYTYITKFS